MSRIPTWLLWVFIIAIGCLMLVGVYFHTQQMDDCDAKGGTLVRSGMQNVCVKQVP